MYKQCPFYTFFKFYLFIFMVSLEPEKIKGKL